MSISDPEHLDSVTRPLLNTTDEASTHRTPDLNIEPGNAGYDLTDGPGTPPSARRESKTSGSVIHATQPASKSLYDTLLTFLPEPHSKEEWYISNSKLDSIFTIGLVKAEIASLFKDRTEEDNDNTAEEVYRGYCKVFAVLLLIDRAKSIIEFIEEHISDDYLPLQLGGGDCFTLSEKEPKEITISGWARIHYHNFAETQWGFYAQFLEKDTNPHGDIPCIRDEAIIPWKVSDSISFTTTHSIVTQVTIDPDYHNFETTSGKLSKFALKTLHSHLQKDFEREIGTLTRFSREGDIQIIQLLKHFTHRGKLYLLFPWAEGGNLNDVWKRHDSPPITKQNIIWMARQCHGIIEGLHQIHERQLSPESRRNSTEHSSNPPEDEREFGLHGDLKPQNILWVTESPEELGTGTLKIADFGLTRFNQEETRSRPHHYQRIRFTPTYRPPESGGLGNNMVRTPTAQQYTDSRATDIWSLGCVYLEFVTWILLGWDEGCTEFSKARDADDKVHNPSSRQNWTEDKFFNIQHDLFIRGYKGVVKYSVVKWIRKLHRHQRCTQYLHDFLGLIQHKMLVIDQTKRAKSGEIEQELQKMVERCHQEDKYAVEPNPRHKKQQGLEFMSRLWRSA